MAVLSAIADEVLSEAIAGAVVNGVLARLTPEVASSDVRELRSSLAAVEQEIRNLTRAIAAGGELSSLLDELRACEQRRSEVQRAISNREQVQEHTVDRAALEAVVRRKLEDWQGLLIRRTQHGRRLLREMLTGPIRFTPIGRAYRFEGEASFGPAISGETDLPTLMVPVRGYAQGWIVAFSGTAA